MKSLIATSHLQPIERSTEWKKCSEFSLFLLARMNLQGLHLEDACRELPHTNDFVESRSTS